MFTAKTLNVTWFNLTGELELRRASDKIISQQTEAGSTVTAI